MEYSKDGEDGRGRKVQVGSHDGVGGDRLKPEHFSLSLCHVDNSRDDGQG
ncbi:hypothetical protein [Laspinema olomoucense]|nr:hypothetical protein [Laspinema sp. D3d]MCT7974779.1 hypothetical protein [Laspinema sp. D3d]